MQLHYLQHVPFETPAYCLDWAKENDVAVSATHLYRGDVLPTIDLFDALIVMGGPMGVHDEADYPWLAGEKQFLTEVVESGKKILGICLGAQLLAHVLGANVVKNKVKEIGWFPVEKLNHPFFDTWPKSIFVFHWHGDRFEIPEGAELLAASEGCDNQAFLYQNQVLGLQFHLESTAESIHALIQNCGDELVPAPYIQTKEAIERDTQQYVRIANNAMKSILTDWLMK